MGDCQLVPLCTEPIMLEDPLFKCDDSYYLSTEESFDRIVEKSVRYITIKERVAADYEGFAGEDRQHFMRM